MPHLKEAPSRPYAQGYNGHAVKCDCAGPRGCAQLKADALIEKYRANGAVALLDADKTVFVGSFWRHHPGHLKNAPRMRSCLQRQLALLARVQARNGGDA